MVLLNFLVCIKLKMSLGRVEEEFAGQQSSLDTMNMAEIPLCRFSSVEESYFVMDHKVIKVHHSIRKRQGEFFGTVLLLLTVIGTELLLSC